MLLFQRCKDGIAPRRRPGLNRQGISESHCLLLEHFANGGGAMEIAGKNVIITGGSRGLGRAYALGLKARGAKPYAVSLHQESLDAFNRETGIPGKVVDVSSEK